MKQQCIPWCQRWTRGRDSYRPAGEVINPDLYGVELIDDDTTAKVFVSKHHYSGSYPAARCRVGLFRMSTLVGVAVFSVPPSQRVIPKWTGHPPNNGVELGRFVLLDDVPGNGESWFLARAMRAMLNKLPDVRAVLSFSDPVPRRRADGVVVKPGHYGTVYQASNARYVGRSKARLQLLSPSGVEVNPRSLSKVRNEERGEAGVVEKLQSMGAPIRWRGESGASYAQRAVAGFHRVRHPGNHAYVFAVGDNKRGTRRAFGQALPYPKPYSS